MISTLDNAASNTITTREEAEFVLHQIAVAMNEKRQTTASMDAEILEAKNKFQPLLAACDERIERACERLEKYADSHPELFPKDRKSVEWNLGKFGFRTDTPSLSPISRTFTWAKILGVITTKRLRKFIRTKCEVDKDAILARCGTLKKPTKFQLKTLPLLGLRLVQEDKFFVEPDLTKMEVRQ
ncbi:MAG: host-nuclease inhibitor Gam family protein [Patescibacteria group bacterium]|nr:host-nuclease inhibitor Gam family protein [Patescibacteria group bacterium]